MWIFQKFRIFGPRIWFWISSGVVIAGVLAALIIDLEEPAVAGKVDYIFALLIAGKFLFLDHLASLSIGVLVGASGVLLSRRLWQPLIDGPGDKEAIRQMAKRTNRLRFKAESARGNPSETLFVANIVRAERLAFKEYRIQGWLPDCPPSDFSYNQLHQVQQSLAELVPLLNRGLLKEARALSKGKEMLW